MKKETVVFALVFAVCSFALALVVPASSAANGEPRRGLLAVPTGGDPSPGDVNCDGSINVIDALFVLQYDVELRDGDDVCPPADAFIFLPACDTNGDGSCDVIDALFILQCDVELNNTLCPLVLTTPLPIDGAWSQSTATELSWISENPFNVPLLYDVYVEAGDTTPDVLVSENQTETTLQLIDLLPNEAYYWQVVAKKADGTSTIGPIWHFVTGDVFAESFDSSSSGWFVGDIGDALFEYNAGEYRMVAQTPNLIFRSLAPVSGPLDYTVEADMRWANGIYNGIYGILFGGVLDEYPGFLSEYYIFFIYADREEFRIRYYFKVGENADGSPILEAQDVVPRTQADVINESFQQNEMKLVFVDDAIDAYINGTQVVNGVAQVGAQQPSLVGLMSVANPSTPGCDARFDDFQLINLSAPVVGNTPLNETVLPTFTQSENSLWD